MSANPVALGGVRRASNTKLVSALVLVLVFLCGCVIGALLIDLVVHNRARSPSFDTASGRAAYFDRLQKELDLTPEQSVQVRSILEDFWQYYRTVLSEARQRVNMVLSTDQKVKFERILQNPPK